MYRLIKIMSAINLMLVLSVLTFGIGLSLPQTAKAEDSAKQDKTDADKTNKEDAASDGVKSSEPSSHGMFNLEEVVVTTPHSVEPLKVETNPKAPYQPVPAHDGAEYLKSIPGFSIIRKGGTDGDPVLRGMSGSRLNVLLDGQQIYGGCGGRMDPPTAYVFPQSYDRLIVIKGPESVIYGPGSSAGVVLFERYIKRFDKVGWKADGSLTFGSFGRNDQVADLRAGYNKGYVQVIGTRTDANDYEDGDGNEVHSSYTRWSQSAAVGWTPNNDTLLELSAIRSDGEAAYADRAMDGSKFERENVALKFVKEDLSPLFKKIDALVYYNYIDHVMDNYSLRTPSDGKYSAMNPDRVTSGGHLMTTLGLSEMIDLTVGVDMKHDVHRSRSAMAQSSGDAATDMYESKDRIEDMHFDQYGVFSEGTFYLSQSNKIIGGLRVDAHKAVDNRDCVASMMCMNNPNDTKGMKDTATLPSGFVRFEKEFGGGAGIWYAGVGHVERFPDYWERLEYAPDTTSTDTGKSSFLTTEPEKTTQLDVGVNWKAKRWSWSVSGFAGKVADYILIRWSPSPTLTRNVDATVVGAEGDLTFELTKTVQLSSSLAYVYGQNETDDEPLAQQPPLEFKLGAQYDNKVFSFGAIWRLVATQDRYDIGYGNIVKNGMDIGQTSGFGVFSLNAGWRPTKRTQLSVGVDNLFNQTYAEHLSRTGSDVLGYLVQTNTRINEPGRNIWVKLNVNFL
ncbi:TonB-denpendent receptor [Candidatus Magnetoovum chiemensis]|nr:TonB-denpendent receptor [Candidatus Magnetoovum chiemensis]